MQCQLRQMLIPATDSEDSLQAQAIAQAVQQRLHGFALVMGAEQVDTGTAPGQQLAALQRQAFNARAQLQAVQLQLGELVPAFPIAVAAAAAHLQVLDLTVNRHQLPLDLLRLQLRLAQEPAQGLQQLLHGGQ